MYESGPRRVLMSVRPGNRREEGDSTVDAGELANALRGIRADLAAATANAEACGLPTAAGAYQRMRDLWLAELDAYAAVFERLGATDGQ